MTSDLKYRFCILNMPESWSLSHRFLEVQSWCWLLLSIVGPLFILQTKCILRREFLLLTRISKKKATYLKTNTPAEDLLGVSGLKDNAWHKQSSMVRTRFNMILTGSQISLEVKKKNYLKIALCPKDPSFYPINDLGPIKCPNFSFINDNGFVFHRYVEENSDI